MFPRAALEHPIVKRLGRGETPFTTKRFLLAPDQTWPLNLEAQATVLGCFLVEQSQQHLVPILVALRIALALGDHPPIEIDVCVVDVIQHWRPPHAGCILSRRKGLTCSILNTRPVFS